MGRPNTRARQALGLGFLATVLVISACQSGPIAQTDSGSAASESESSEVSGGALLWKQNCSRCHNYRAPREHSDREWRIIVHHMRVRANLTAEEHRLILRFLQNAN